MTSCSSHLTEPRTRFSFSKSFFFLPPPLPPFIGSGDILNGDFYPSNDLSERRVSAQLAPPSLSSKWLPVTFLIPHRQPVGGPGEPMREEQLLHWFSLPGAFAALKALLVWILPSNSFQSRISLRNNTTALFLLVCLFFRMLLTCK